MILTGLDGGLQGNDDEGVLVGHDMYNLFPLQKSCFKFGRELLTQCFQ